MSKKTESIEFRLSPEQKQDLARRVAADGQTMSGYLRTLVAQDLAEQDETASVYTPGADQFPHDQTSGGQTFGGVPPEHNSSAARKGSVLPFPMQHLRTGLALRMSVMVLPALVLAAGYITSSSMPAGASGEARVTFAELDSNADGKVTEAEYLASAHGDEPAMPPVPAACEGSEVAAELSRPVEDILREDMAQIDANADQVITYEELESVMMREVVETFLDADEDGNGLVTQAEVIAYEVKDVHEVLPSPEELAEDLGATAECIVALQAALEQWDAEWEADVAAMEAGDSPDLDLTTAEGARLFIAEYDHNRDGQLSLSEVIHD